jgi:arsenate reductase-like glutaredoxin family protein
VSEAIALMVQNPSLIKRPVLQINKTTTSHACKPVFSRICTRAFSPTHHE